MQDETQFDSIEICDLEYDVAALGAVEASTTETNHYAAYFISYRLPEPAR